MPGILHEHAIDRILDAQPNAKRKGFGKAVKALLRSYQLTEDGRWRAHVVPDAYLIDRKNKAVVAYEVEDTGRLTSEKLRRYFNLAWEINEPRWTLLLIVSDRWGNMVGIDPLMLDIEEQVAKVKKKAEEQIPKHGPCPCCGRQFLNLTLHMRIKHPDYKWQ